MILIKQFTAFLKFGSVMALALPLILSPAPVIANGGSGDSDPPTNVPADNSKPKKKFFVIKCFNGKIWDKQKKKCIEEEQSDTLNQDSIYDFGRDLARAGKYENAIRVLLLARDQSDPRVLNYLGYSNRKLGNMDKALRYYHAAVASNPDFTLVREYLGEAYIQLGLLEKAREQLTQLERICGSRSCREYSILSKYMVEYQLR